jgi:hypothetical protein
MKRPKVIVSGALAHKHGQGGEAWVRLSWVLGFRRLGYEVLFLEQMDRAPHPEALGYFETVIAQFGLSDSAALINNDGTVFAGVPLRRIAEVAREAEALINISGHLTFEPIMERVQPRVYLDIDPGFTQFWHAAGIAGARLEHHDLFFTIGANIGRDDCEIPTGGVVWRQTRPPVVLEEWPFIRSASPGLGAPLRFTTVANWRGSFGAVQFAGKTYGLKVHEFRKVIELPRRSTAQFEIALQIYPGDGKDLHSLIENGWCIVDPALAAATPDSFRQYVQHSGAEFSVAQGVYVGSSSGWFSDRTVRYLASGKPALVQDTGFKAHIPCGEGLLAFRTLDEAIAGSEQVAARYGQHCRSARELAEEYFDSDKVIRKLMEEVGGSRSAREMSPPVELSRQ